MPYLSNLTLSSTDHKARRTLLKLRATVLQTYQRCGFAEVMGDEGLYLSMLWDMAKGCTPEDFAWIDADLKLPEGTDLYLVIADCMREACAAELRPIKDILINGGLRWLDRLGGTTGEAIKLWGHMALNVWRLGEHSVLHRA